MIVNQAVDFLIIIIKLVCKISAMGITFILSLIRIRELPP